MPLLGSHLSIAGGFFKAPDAAAALGMETVQIFTHSPSQWAIRPGATSGVVPWTAPPLSDDAVRAFRESVERGGLRIPCAHSSYLINLASGDETLWRKSVEAFVVELDRAEALGLAGLVLHPGSAVDLSEEEAIGRIVRALDEALDRTRGRAIEVWLETTAGQGSSIGHRFEQIATILERVRDAGRIGVCVDSCHIFAAGYPLIARAEYDATMGQLDATIGLGRIRAFHLNDSKKALGSRVDRHEHIGEGHLGLEPFRHILNDARFARLPMYLETPKGTRDGENLDTINLRTLRSLMGDSSGREGDSTAGRPADKSTRISTGKKTRTKAPDRVSSEVNSKKAESTTTKSGAMKSAATKRSGSRKSATRTNQVGHE